MVGGTAHRAAVEAGERAETVGPILTMPGAHLA